MNESQTFRCGCSHEQGQWFPCPIHRHLAVEDLPEAIDLFEMLSKDLQAQLLADPYHPDPLPRTMAATDPHPYLRLIR